jgi:opacity protein-like surface antigen
MRNLQLALLTLAVSTAALAAEPVKKSTQTKTATPTKGATAKPHHQSTAKKSTASTKQETAKLNRPKPSSEHKPTKGAEYYSPKPTKGAEYREPRPVTKGAVYKPKPAAKPLPAQTIRGVGGFRVGWDYATIGQNKHIQFLNSDPAPDLLETSQTTSSRAMYGGFLGLEFPLKYSYPMRWQTAVGFYQTNSMLTNGIDYFFSLPEFGNKSYSYKVTNQRVLLENKFMFEMVHWLYGYAMGGVGISFNKAYAYKEVAIDITTPADGFFQDNTSAALAYSGGVGVEAFIVDNFRMSFGYQFSELGQIEFGQYNNSNTGQTLTTTPTPTQELILQFTAVF